jgi:glycyl-tRNA synthetase
MEKQNDQSRMDRIVSLAKRRGFIFQSSEIYGGLNGFWDYGPLGVALKRNLKDAWWHDMVAGHDELAALPGAPSEYEMAGLDCTIIMHPQVWKCSGHFDLFHDWMIDCRESKRRYRYDHLHGRWAAHRGKKAFVTTDQSGDEAPPDTVAKAQKFFGLRAKQVDEIEWTGGLESLAGAIAAGTVSLGDVLGPDAAQPGTLTAPREFNLMFETRIGALAGDDDDRAFLRPETAQGIFVNFKNVLDTSRVRVPFGIAQIGKSFRNEITPRNFTLSLFGGHGRHRIRVPVPGGGRIRRAGGDRTPRRLRPAQPHGGEARPAGWRARGRDGGGRQAAAPRQRQRPLLLRRREP